MEIIRTSNHPQSRGYLEMINLIAQNQGLQWARNANFYPAVVTREDGINFYDKVVHQQAVCPFGMEKESSLKIEVAKLVTFREAGNEALIYGVCERNRVPTLPFVGSVRNRIRGKCYVVTDYVKGAVSLAETELGSVEDLQAAIDVGLWTLSLLHKAGVLHGDIDATNMVFGNDGVLRVFDFEGSKRYLLGVPRIEQKGDNFMLVNSLCRAARAQGLSQDEIVDVLDRTGL